MMPQIDANLCRLSHFRPVYVNLIEYDMFPSCELRTAHGCK